MSLGRRPEPGSLPIHFLNVGTRILLKDIMDQYLRSLGEHRTFYAEDIAWARRSLVERPVDIVITEMELNDGSAYRLLQYIREEFASPDLYVILAVEESNRAVNELSEEMEANAILTKPITATSLKAQVERYLAWKNAVKEPWRDLVREGRKLAREKRFVEAETKFRQAMIAGPEIPATHCAAGIFHMAKPDLVAAEKCLQKALELNPGYVQAISALGILHLSKGQLDEAEKCLKDAQFLSPLNPDRLLRLARLNLERALGMCQKSLQMDTSSVQARLQLGKILAAQRDYIGAVRELDKLLPSLPDGREKSETQTYLALSRKLGGLAKD